MSKFYSCYTNPHRRMKESCSTGFRIEAITSIKGVMGPFVLDRKGSKYKENTLKLASQVPTGTTIYMKNTSLSFSLCRRLLYEHRVYVCGTIRENHLPAAMKELQSKLAKV